MARLEINLSARGFTQGKRGIDNVTTSLEKLDDTIRLVDFDKLTKKLATVGSTFKSVSGNIKALNADFSKLSNQKINNSFTQASTDVEKYRASLARLKTENQSLRNELVKNKGAIDQQKIAFEQGKVAQQTHRTETARLQAEITKLRLAQAQNRQQTVAAAGSYREAQQRLTALGKSIREAQNGFTRMTPALRAQINEYRNLNAQLTQFDRRMGLNFRNIGNYGSALSALSPQLGMLTGQMGAFVAAGLLIRDVYKRISQFDSGMRNVEKTTGLTRRQIDALGQEFVELSRSLQTVSATNLTQYATVAGQLGVKGTKDILAFAEALAKLETATNISGEQGGAEIARTLTLIEGGVQNVAKFGDEIVNLGNNFAATEKEILENAEAIAQNTTIYGFGRQEVLAYAAASRSLGIQQEVVGSTFQKTLGTFERAIRTGKGLDEILKVVGGSAEQLGKRFNEDASGVLQDYIKGLNGIARAGGSVMEQMERNGIVDIRQRRVIGTLATGYDTLARAIDTSRNSAGSLEQEFGVQSEKLIKQTERIGIAWENLILTVDRGEGVFGESVSRMSGALADFIDLLNELQKRDTALGRFFFGGRAGGGIDTGGESERLPRAGVFPIAQGSFGQSSNLFAEYRQGLQDSEDATKALLEAQKELLKAEGDVGDQVVKNKEYWEDVVKSIRDSIEAMDISTRGTKEWTAAQNKLAEAQRNLDEYSKKTIGGATARTTGKSQADLIREANEALSKGQVGALNGIDAKLLRIDNKYDSILKKINRVTDATVRGQLTSVANVNKQLEISNTRLDAWLKTYRKSNFGATLPTPTGQLAPVPADLPYVEETMERLAKGGKVQFGDKDLEKRLGRVVERGLRRGIDDIFRDIDDLGSNFYEVFSNTFGKLATTITNTFGQVLSTQLGDLLSKSINSDSFDIGGLGSTRSKIAVAGGGLLGGILSSQGQQRANTGLSVAGGALSGAAAGTAILPGIGTAVGAVVGAISGIFSSSGAKKAERQRQEQLAEQRKQTALAERQAALAYGSSIIGQSTNQGIVSGFERDSFGNIVFKIEGKDLVATLDRQNNSR